MGSNPSFIWRSILAAKDLLKGGIYWRIGNGKSVRIWQDSWLHQLSTFKPQTSRNLLGIEAKVELLIQPETKEWNTSLIQAAFSKEEAKLIRQVPISQSNQQDRMIWISNVDGNFKVRSA